MEPWAATELYLNTGFGFHSNDARGTTFRVDSIGGVTPVDPSLRWNYDIAYYYPSRRPAEMGEGIDNLHFHPAELRTVRLTLTRRW